MGKSQRQKIAESIQREDLADELRRIIAHAKRIRDDRRNLRFSYRKWYYFNQATIESLTKLLDTILTVNTAANAVAGIASLAEILGSVLCIAGAIGDKRNIIETGDKISKGGSVVNVGTFAIKYACLKELCNKATENFQKNKEYSDALEDKRYSYFQQLEVFKRELRTVEANNSLPLLLETAQREGFDFIGDLGLDDSTKSMLRTNLRQMCRSNSKKIKATTQMTRTHELGRVLTRDIRRLLHEFKEVLDEDDSLFSIFSEETKKFLGENVESLFPFLDTTESWLNECSVVDLLRGGTTLYGISSTVASASRTEIGVMGGVRVFSGFNDLMMRINDIGEGSISKESEELKKRIKEMKEIRKNIIKIIGNRFGWYEIPVAELRYPALTN